MRRGFCLHERCLGHMKRVGVGMLIEGFWAL